MLTYFPLTVYVLSESREFTQYDVLATPFLTFRELVMSLCYPPWYSHFLSPSFFGYHLPGPLLQFTEGQQFTLPQTPMAGSHFTTPLYASLCPGHTIVEATANVYQRALLYSSFIVVCL